MTESLHQQLFGPSAEQAALLGRRVQRVDVPSARGTVRQVVSRTSLLVRWDGMTTDHLEACDQVEVVR